MGKVMQVQHDESIPNELTQEIGILHELVADYFHGDLKKTALWFQIKNPALGNISPHEMILSGRYRKLEQFVCNAFVGNQP
jgi:hypothetical protein